MGGVKVVNDGLVDLVKVLKGPAFRQVNAELRHYAPQIAERAIPHVQLAVSLSRAPQARAMAGTVRTKRDRVPVIFIGAVNPKFRTEKKFTRKGSDSRRRRGSIAHGIMKGPKGGHRDTAVAENYYQIPRDDDGGALGRTLRDGPAIREVEIAYLKFYVDILKAHGLKASV